MYYSIYYTLINMYILYIHIYAQSAYIQIPRWKFHSCPLVILIISVRTNFIQFGEEIHIRMCLFRFVLLLLLLFSCNFYHINYCTVTHDITQVKRYYMVQRNYVVIRQQDIQSDTLKQQAFLADTALFIRERERELEFSFYIVI